MNLLREIEKDIKKYLRLITKDQEIAKAYCQDYLAHIQNTLEILKEYIESKEEIFGLWCNESVDNFSTPTDTLFMSFVRTVNMSIINANLNRISKDISKAKILKRRLEEIKIRFDQYEYLRIRSQKEESR